MSSKFYRESITISFVLIAQPAEASSSSAMLSSQANPALIKKKTDLLDLVNKKNAEKQKENVEDNAAEDNGMEL